MSEHSYTGYRVVAVVWRDSHTNRGWRDASDTERDIKPIVTVGFLVGETESTITVAPAIGGWSTFMDPTTIPWEAVCYMEDLAVEDLANVIERAREHSP